MRVDLASQVSVNNNNNDNELSSLLILIGSQRISFKCTAYI